jgi:hypothetical protein
MKQSVTKFGMLKSVTWIFINIHLFMRKARPGFLKYTFNASRSDNLAKAEVLFFYHLHC